MLYLVSQTCRSMHSLAGNLLTSKCALCLVCKECTLFKGTGGLSVHVFCQCGLDPYSSSALGTGSSTENWSGEAGHGQKGMPFITAFRTLDDMAVLSTTDLTYGRPIFLVFLITTTERSLDRRQCYCLCLVYLWLQLYFSFWTEYEWSWGESSSTTFSKAVNIDTKNTTRLKITVILIMSLQNIYTHFYR